MRLFCWFSYIVCSFKVRILWYPTHCRFSYFFVQGNESNATNRQKVHKYIREFSPGCEVSSTAFPSKCCRNVATRAVRHILSCCSPFTSRGVKEGKGEKYVHSSPANPRKHLTAVVIHHSPCLQNRFNYFLGMQPHIFSSDSSLRIRA